MQQRSVRSLFAIGCAVALLLPILSINYLISIAGTDK